MLAATVARPGPGRRIDAPAVEDRMPSFTLTDLARDIWTDAFELTPADLGLAIAPTPGR